MLEALVTDYMGPVIVRYLADLDAASLRLAAPEGSLEAKARVSAAAERLWHHHLEVESHKRDPDHVESHHEQAVAHSEVVELREEVVASGSNLGALVLSQHSHSLDHGNCG